MKKRWISRMTALLLCLALAAGVLPGTARAAEAVSYIECSWDEAANRVVTSTKFVTEYTTVTSDLTEWNTGWYVAEGSITIGSAVRVTGDVKLILADQANLNVQGGIIVNEGNSLTVYAQSADGTAMGKLTATSQSYDNGIGNAAIGGEKSCSAGTITIHGGVITAKGAYKKTSGIGSGYDCDGGTVIIYGGTVTASGGSYAAGIGCEYAIDPVTICSTVTIYGGTVTAKGGSLSAGIGGTYYDSCGNVTIYGGTVTAQGDDFQGVGIGGGYGGSAGNITIYGGTVTATGGSKSAGIGGTAGGGAVNIHGGTVTAIGSTGGAGIGGSYYSTGSNVTISGGTVNATGGGHGAGIGGGDDGAGGTVTITGGTVNAIGDISAAGIGGGASGAGGTVTITGGTVTATGGKSAAGIGGGIKGAGGTVTISGGNVKVIAGTEAESIGGGDGKESTGTLTDGSGNAVALQVLTLDGVAAGTAITGITGVNYGLKEVTTLDTNKLYFYLPAEACVETVTAGGEEYICKAGLTYYKNHIPNADDGDCTTDILCSGCNNYIFAEGMESHIPGQDDGDCTTDILCVNCDVVMAEGAESHTPDADDGDCTTPIPCTQCEQMAVAGKTHNFEYGECANDGCNVRQTFTMTYYVDGVQVHQETYTCGSAYFLWTPEEKDGLTFLGWAETEGGEVKYPDWEYIWPAEDLTFHAVYGTVYTVRYYSYDAEQDSYFDNGTATVVAGDTLTLGEQFSYWYKCVGWATEEKGRMVYTVGQEITPTGDLKLYSVVEPFSAQVELGAEDAVYDRTVISGELPYSGVILTRFPTRPGYVFTGWLDEDGMFHEPFENEEGVRCIEIIFGKDTTLTAQWELCTHTPGEDGKCANCGMAVVTVKELPETVEAEIGEKAAVTVEATGKNLTYTWYFANPGKDTFSVTTAFTGPEYSVAMSESRNGRRIYCLVTDENGFFAKTNIVTLRLPRTELAIVTQPEDVTVAEGEKATVTFEAVGDGLTYTWYYANPGKDTFSKTTSFTS